MDGVQSRTPKVAAYNNGNVPFELHIRSNSIITAVGKYNPKNVKNIEAKRIELQDIFNTSELVSKFMF